MQVDIIILTYNRSNKLKNAINSVLRQTYKNIRILIFDDNSSDNTQDIVNSFKDKRIFYYKNRKNLGMFKNWQHALANVKSEFFIPMLGDDDEFIYDNYIKEGVEFIKKYNLDFVIFGGQKNVNNNILIDMPKNLKFNHIYNGKEIIKNFLDYQLYGNANGVFKSDLIKYLLIDVNHLHISDELILMMNLILHSKKIMLVDKISMQWNFDEKSYSNKNKFFLYKNITNHLSFLHKAEKLLKKLNYSLSEFKKFFNEYTLYAIDDAVMGYHMNNISRYLSKLKIENEVYIYGNGMISSKIKEFLQENNIKLLGIVDDFRKTSLKISQIEKNKNIIIASLKKSVIHEMYKNLIKNGIKDNNILELI